MTQTEALIALNLSMRIGSIRLQRLLDVFGSPEDIFAASYEQLTRLQGIDSVIAGYISGFQRSALDEELSRIHKYDLRVVTLFDDAYPRNLRYIADKPIVLYVKGSLDVGDSLALAMVGCRRPSFYGIEQAGLFAQEFARRGIAIISGLARGIDTCSHEGALKAGGRTIAVIGSGLGNIYPPENEDLAVRISTAGAVISEFPICAKPERYNFPRRNRIISGLALGVLVVEAGRNSGSLISARCALDQNREVFALPGKIDTPQACGTNSLIRDGACLVRCVDDVLESLPFLSVLPGEPQEVCGSSGGSRGSLSCLESTLYNIISHKPVSIEVLMEETQMGIAELSGHLLNLQLKRFISQVSSGTYIRSHNGD
jgi:DNA processing protein